MDNRFSPRMRRKAGFWNINELCELAGVNRKNVEHHLINNLIPRPSVSWGEKSRLYYTTEQVEELKELLIG